MGCWTEVEFNIKYPKENISNIVKEVLDGYDYDETWHKSFYTEEKGVNIIITSTLNINILLPVLNKINYEINDNCFMAISTFFGVSSRP